MTWERYLEILCVFPNMLLLEFEDLRVILINIKFFKFEKLFIPCHSALGE